MKLNTNIKFENLEVSFQNEFNCMFIIFSSKLYVTLGEIQIKRTCSVYIYTIQKMSLMPAMFFVQVLLVFTGII